MTPSVVVFDIGGVLIDWQPQRAWSGELDSVAAHDFMERVGFRSRNLRGDQGTSFATLAAEIDDPEDAQRLADYVGLFPRTVQHKITGTWDILYSLKAAGIPVHAITNWSSETWPQGLKAHPELGEVFDTLVVSGREGLIKPDPRIYHLLCERAGVLPQDCVFIDDGAHNVDGAKAVGMDGIHFTDPAALHSALNERGLL